MKRNWIIKDNIHKAMNEIGKKLNFNTIEDWYNLTRKDVINLGYPTLIKYAEESPMNLVSIHFPEYDWKPWLFKHRPRKFWLKKDSLERYYAWLKEKLNIQTTEDWYKVGCDEVKKYCGHGFDHHKNLQLFYPNYEWKPWLFKNSPKKIWNDPKIRKQYFEWLKKELKISNYEDWCNITLDKLKPYNVGGLINRHYKGGIYSFCKENAPEYDWKPWLFPQVSTNYWKDIEHHREYGLWLAQQLDISKPEHWYDVTQEDFQLNAGGSLISMKYTGTPAKFVTTIFPELNLDYTKFKKKRKGQSRLFRIIKEYFPNEKILWEHKHPNIRSSYNRKLELDVYLPNLKIAFEFQGTQHIKLCKFFSINEKTFAQLQENDKIKKDRCKQLGITLIEVNYDKDYRRDPKNTVINLIRRHYEARSSGDARSVKTQNI